MKHFKRHPPGSQLFGVPSIARFCGLSELETQKRLENGELPHERAGQLYIVSKDVLRAAMATPHWNRDRLAA